MAKTLRIKVSILNFTMIVLKLLYRF